MWRILFVAMSLSGSGLAVAAAPELATATVSTARADIRIWNVKATSAVRQGSSSSNESGTIALEHRDGSVSEHDATYTLTSGTLFQDGEVCHNFGPRCYCGTTTFRFEAGASLWKFGTPSNNQPVDCPSGIAPTGDAEIRRSLSAADLEARKQQILKERAAARNKNH